MSDTNRVGLRIVKEEDGVGNPTPGVTPTNPQLDILPYTGSSDLGFTPETTTSNIIRSDRQVSDLVLVNGSVGGGFDTELIAGNALDSLLEGVLFADSSFSAEASVVSGASVLFSDVTGGTTLTGTGVHTGLSIGDMVLIEVSGETDILAPVLFTATGSLSIGAATTITGSNSTTITKLPAINNGVTQASYTMERTYREGEGDQFREVLRGMVPGTFSVSASASSIVTGSFGFIGQTQSFTNQIGGSPTRPAASAFEVYNAASNVATIAIGGEPMGDNFVMEASIEIENNLRERNALGTLGAISVGAGEFSVTGSLSTYFNDASLIQTVIDNSETSLTLGFDKGDESIVFYLPRVKFSEGTPDVSGKNADVMANISFQAILDDSTGYTMSIAKVQN